MVVGLRDTASGVVLDRRVVRFRSSSSSTRRKGRYLLPVSKGRSGGVWPSLLLLLVWSFSRWVDSDKSPPVLAVVAGGRLWWSSSDDDREVGGGGGGGGGDGFCSEGLG